MQTATVTTPNEVVMIREAVDIFLGKDDLQLAIDDLIEAGFKRSAFGLLAGEYSVQQKLGDMYVSTNKYMGSANAPNTAFVHKDSIGDTVHALTGQLYFLGASTLAGGAVLSAGILGGAAMVASAGVIAVGAVGAVIGMILHQSDAEYLEEHVNAGNLVLFVRINDSRQESRAKTILAKHCNFYINNIKVLSVPANRQTALTSL